VWQLALHLNLKKSFELENKLLFVNELEGKLIEKYRLIEILTRENQQAFVTPTDQQTGNQLPKHLGTIVS
jgi:hypothetical protein